MEVRYKNELGELCIFKADSKVCKGLYVTGNQNRVKFNMTQADITLNKANGNVSLSKRESVVIGTMICADGQYLQFFMSEKFNIRFFESFDKDDAIKTLIREMYKLAGYKTVNDLLGGRE